MAITASGIPIYQVDPQLTDVSQSSNLRVDNTSGPGRGWIYLPYRNGGGYQVASAPAVGYTSPSSWQANLVTRISPRSSHGSTSTRTERLRRLGHERHRVSLGLVDR